MIRTHRSHLKYKLARTVAQIAPILALYSNEEIEYLPLPCPIDLIWGGRRTILALFHCQKREKFLSFRSSERDSNPRLFDLDWKEVINVPNSCRTSEKFPRLQLKLDRFIEIKICFLAMRQSSLTMCSEAYRQKCKILKLFLPCQTFEMEFSFSGRGLWLFCFQFFVFFRWNFLTI